MSLAALANQVVANINLNLQPFPTNKSTIDAKDFNESKMFFFGKHVEWIPKCTPRNSKGNSHKHLVKIYK